MKPRSRQFYPPKLTPCLVSTLQKIAPWVAHTIYQLDLMISVEPLVHLNALQGHPCLLLCNHPTFDDQVVLFLLSAHLGQPFYYLTAHEQFVGMKGWLYQHIGAYSIQRGLPDRASVSQTMQLLTQPDCKLVIFAEGGCSFQNDTVMPFRPGAVQIGLQTLARQKKQGTPIPDLFVVPISLKYRYTGKMVPVIDQSLRALERSLGVIPQGDYYQRLRAVAERVLSRYEQDYGLVPPDLHDWNQRIAALKTEVLYQCEQRLGLTAAPGEPDRERVYRVRHTLELRQNTRLADGTDAWDVMSKAMIRMLNFDAIYDGYVAEKPTPERFLDTLVRLEREVFGIDQPRPKGHRQAFLRIAEPINLKNYLDAYQTNRSGTVTDLTQQIQHTIQRNLDMLSEATARGISW